MTFDNAGNLVIDSMYYNGIPPEDLVDRVTYSGTTVYYHGSLYSTHGYDTFQFAANHNLIQENSSTIEGTVTRYGTYTTGLNPLYPFYKIAPVFINTLLLTLDQSLLYSQNLPTSETQANGARYSYNTTFQYEFSSGSLTRITATVVQDGVGNTGNYQYTLDLFY
jgi:uncharacterized membrane protein